MLSFAAARCRENPVALTLDDAMLPTRIAQAITRSLRTGLPEDFDPLIVVDRARDHATVSCPMPKPNQRLSPCKSETAALASAIAR
jgi:hypothetical protein